MVHRLPVLYYALNLYECQAKTKKLLKGDSMDFREILKLQFDEYESVTESLMDGLSDEERRFMPSEASHHIDFALWHASRAEDILLNYGVREEEQLWIRGGWAVKFGIPSADTGLGYTGQQVKDMPAISLDDLLAYYKAVRAETLECVRTIEPGEMDKRSPFERLHRQLPEVTKGGVLAHMVVEPCQHLGQIGYIRGIIRGL